MAPAHESAPGQDERPWREDREYRREKYDLLQQIVSLDEMDDEQRVVTRVIQKELDDILGKLRTIAQHGYREDPDLRELIILYTDLKTDFEDGKKLSLDDSFDLIIEEMEARISEQGVVRRSPEAVTDFGTQAVLRELKSKGVQADYVVMSGNPNARTVVVFLQNHISSRTDNSAQRTSLEVAAGVPQSQAEISRALRAGVGDVVFLEGFSRGLHIYNSDKITSLKRTPEWNQLMPVEQVAMERAAAGQVAFRGYEQLGDTYGRKYNEYRATAQNVFISGAITEGLDSSDIGLPVIIIGSQHETRNPLMSSSPLPISQILAADGGFNVVVVDAATEYFNGTEVRRLVKSDYH